MANLKVGDYVRVYKYDANMRFGFFWNMKNYIDKPCRIIEMRDDAIRLKPIGWKDNHNYYWHESVLKKYTKEEARNLWIYEI